jgi:predicted alpha/beta hydrolase family esterase
MLYCYLVYMLNAVILHGKPTRERFFDPTQPKPHVTNWFPWIGKKLLEEGVDISIPPLPQPYYPIYEAWRTVFEKQKMTKDTGLIGHSAGAEFILRWLSINKDVSVERVVLVAPYRDYDGKYEDFSKYDLDKDLCERIGKVTIINSLDDDAPIQRRTQELITAYPTAKYIELDGYGHFRIGHNMTSQEFPILFDELIS